MGIDCSKVENKNTDNPPGKTFFVNTGAPLDNLKFCPNSINEIHPITPPIAVCKPNNLNKNGVPLLIQTTYSSDTIQHYFQGNKEHEINNKNTVNLRIFHQNIRGLRNKTEEMIMHLSNRVPHVLCFTEHHLKEFEINNTRINQYNLGAYYCRVTRKHGGVGIFIHDTLSYTSIDLSEYCNEQDLEACALKFKISNNVFCIYTDQQEILKLSFICLNYYLINFTQIPLM